MFYGKRVYAPLFDDFSALAEKTLLAQFFSKTPISCQNRRTLEQNARNPHGCSLFLFYSQTLRSTLF